jgi:hypothetical protein
MRPRERGLIWLLVAWMLLVHAAYYWYLAQAYAPALLGALHVPEILDRVVSPR